MHIHGGINRGRPANVFYLWAFDVWHYSLMESAVMAAALEIARKREPAIG